MKKKLVLRVIRILLFFILFISSNSVVHAETMCANKNITVKVNGKEVSTESDNKPSINVTEGSVNFTISGSLTNNEEYYLHLTGGGADYKTPFIYNGSNILINVSGEYSLDSGGQKRKTVWVNILSKEENKICFAGEYFIINDKLSSCDVNVNYYHPEGYNCVDKSSTNNITITVSSVLYRGDPKSDFAWSFNQNPYMLKYSVGQNIDLQTKDLRDGTNSFEIFVNNGSDKVCDFSITKFEECKPGDVSDNFSRLKSQNVDAPKQGSCFVAGVAGIETAIGCIPTEKPQGFIGWVLGYAISIGGGIAFLLMVWGGFLLSTSSGNPEKIKQGQEVLTSAVVGLLFIIFSVFLLRFIGLDILRIPGFK